jgi:hypothetical protein
VRRAVGFLRRSARAAALGRLRCSRLVLAAVAIVTFNVGGTQFVADRGGSRT